MLTCGDGFSDAGGFSFGVRCPNGCLYVVGQFRMRSGVSGLMGWANVLRKLSRCFGFGLGPAKSGNQLKPIEA